MRGNNGKREPLSTNLFYRARQKRSRLNNTIIQKKLKYIQQYYSIFAAQEQHPRLKGVSLISASETTSSEKDANNSQNEENSGSTSSGTKSNSKAGAGQNFFGFFARAFSKEMDGASVTDMSDFAATKSRKKRSKKEVPVPSLFDIFKTQDDLSKGKNIDLPQTQCSISNLKEKNLKHVEKDVPLGTIVNPVISPSIIHKEIKHSVAAPKVPEMVDAQLPKASISETIDVKQSEVAFPKTLDIEVTEATVPTKVNTKQSKTIHSENSDTETLTSVIPKVFQALSPKVKVPETFGVKLTTDVIPNTLDTKFPETANGKALDTNDELSNNAGHENQGVKYLNSNFFTNFKNGKTVKDRPKHQFGATKSKTTDPDTIENKSELPDAKEPIVEINDPIVENSGPIVENSEPKIVDKIPLPFSGFFSNFIQDTKSRVDVTSSTSPKMPVKSATEDLGDKNSSVEKSDNKGETERPENVKTQSPSRAKNPFRKQNSPFKTDSPKRNKSPVAVNIEIESMSSKRLKSPVALKDAKRMKSPENITSPNRAKRVKNAQMIKSPVREKSPNKIKSPVNVKSTDLVSKTPLDVRSHQNTYSPIKTQDTPPSKIHRDRSASPKRLKSPFDDANPYGLTSSASGETVDGDKLPFNFNYLNNSDRTSAKKMKSSNFLGLKNAVTSDSKGVKKGTSNFRQVGAKDPSDSQANDQEATARLVHLNAKFFSNFKQQKKMKPKPHSIVKRSYYVSSSKSLVKSTSFKQYILSLGARLHQGVGTGLDLAERTGTQQIDPPTSLIESSKSGSTEDGHGGGLGRFKQVINGIGAYLNTEDVERNEPNEPGQEMDLRPDIGFADPILTNSEKEKNGKLMEDKRRLSLTRDLDVFSSNDFVDGKINNSKKHPEQNDESPAGCFTIESNRAPVKDTKVDMNSSEAFGDFDYKDMRVDKALKEKINVQKSPTVTFEVKPNTVDDSNSDQAIDAFKIGTETNLDLSQHKGKYANIGPNLNDEKTKAELLPISGLSCVKNLNETEMREHTMNHQLPFEAESKEESSHIKEFNTSTAIQQSSRLQKPDEIEPRKEPLINAEIVNNSSLDMAGSKEELGMLVEILEVVRQELSMDLKGSKDQLSALNEAVEELKRELTRDMGVVFSTEQLEAIRSFAVKSRNGIDNVPGPMSLSENIHKYANQGISNDTVISTRTTEGCEDFNARIQGRVELTADQRRDGVSDQSVFGSIGDEMGLPTLLPSEDDDELGIDIVHCKRREGQIRQPKPQGKFKNNRNFLKSITLHGKDDTKLESDNSECKSSGPNSSPCSKTLENRFETLEQKPAEGSQESTIVVDNSKLKNLNLLSVAVESQINTDCVETERSNDSNIQSNDERCFTMSGSDTSTEVPTDLFVVGYKGLPIGKKSHVPQIKRQSIGRHPGQALIHPNAFLRLLNSIEKQPACETLQPTNSSKESMDENCVNFPEQAHDRFGDVSLSMDIPTSDTQYDDLGHNSDLGKIFPGLWDANPCSDYQGGSGFLESKGKDKRFILKPAGSEVALSNTSADVSLPELNLGSDITITNRNTYGKETTKEHSLPSLRAEQDDSNSDFLDSTVEGRFLPKMICKDIIDQDFKYPETASPIPSKLVNLSDSTMTNCSFFSGTWNSLFNNDGTNVENSNRGGRLTNADRADANGDGSTSEMDKTKDKLKGGNLFNLKKGVKTNKITKQALKNKNNTPKKTSTFLNTTRGELGESLYIKNEEETQRLHRERRIEDLVILEERVKNKRNERPTLPINSSSYPKDRSTAHNTVSPGLEYRKTPNKDRAKNNSKKMPVQPKKDNRSQPHDSQSFGNSLKNRPASFDLGAFDTFKGADTYESKRSYYVTEKQVKMPSGSPKDNIQRQESFARKRVNRSVSPGGELPNQPKYREHRSRIDSFHKEQELKNTKANKRQLSACKTEDLLKKVQEVSKKMLERSSQKGAAPPIKEFDTNLAQISPNDTAIKCPQMDALSKKEKSSAGQESQTENNDSLLASTDNDEKLPTQAKLKAKRNGDKSLSYKVQSFSKESDKDHERAQEIPSHDQTHEVQKGKIAIIKECIYNYLVDWKKKNDGHFLYRSGHVNVPDADTIADQDHNDVLLPSHTMPTVYRDDSDVSVAIDGGQNGPGQIPEVVDELPNSDDLAAPCFYDPAEDFDKDVKRAFAWPGGPIRGHEGGSNDTITDERQEENRTNGGSHESGVDCLGVEKQAEANSRLFPKQCAVVDQISREGSSDNLMPCFVEPTITSSDTCALETTKTATNSCLQEEPAAINPCCLEPTKLTPDLSDDVKLSSSDPSILEYSLLPIDPCVVEPTTIPLDPCVLEPATTSPDNSVLEPTPFPLDPCLVEPTTISPDTSITEPTKLPLDPCVLEPTIISPNPSIVLEPTPLVQSDERLQCDAVRQSVSRDLAQDRTGSIQGTVFTKQTVDADAYRPAFSLDDDDDPFSSSVDPPTLGRGRVVAIVCADETTPKLPFIEMQSSTSVLNTKESEVTKEDNIVKIMKEDNTVETMTGNNIVDTIKGDNIVKTMKENDFVEKMKGDNIVGTMMNVLDKEPVAIMVENHEVCTYNIPLTHTETLPIESGESSHKANKVDENTGIETNSCPKNVQSIIEHQITKELPCTSPAVNAVSYPMTPSSPSILSNKQAREVEISSRKNALPATEAINKTGSEIKKENSSETTFDALSQILPAKSSFKSSSVDRKETPGHPPKQGLHSPRRGERIIQSILKEDVIIQSISLVSPTKSHSLPTNSPCGKHDAQSETSDKDMSVVSDDTHSEGPNYTQEVAFDLHHEISSARATKESKMSERRNLDQKYTEFLVNQCNFDDFTEEQDNKISEDMEIIGKYAGKPANQQEEETAHVKWWRSHYNTSKDESPTLIEQTVQNLTPKPNAPFDMITPQSQSRSKGSQRLKRSPKPPQRHLPWGKVYRSKNVQGNVQSIGNFSRKTSSNNISMNRGNSDHTKLNHKRQDEPRNKTCNKVDTADPTLPNIVRKKGLKREGTLLSVERDIRLALELEQQVVNNLEQRLSFDDHASLDLCRVCF